MFTSKDSQQLISTFIATPLTEEQKKEWADMQARREAERLEKERLEKQAYEVIDIIVGQHLVCGGDISYHSRVTREYSHTEIIGAKPRYVGDKEDTHCRCLRCHSMINARLPEFRQKVLEYRKRKA